MIKYFFAISAFIFISSLQLKGQDVIVKCDGSTILSKVIKVGSNEIEYKKYNNLDGPLYTIKKDEVQSINYPNGEIDKFNTFTHQNEISENIIDSSVDDSDDLFFNNQLLSDKNNLNYRYIGSVSKKNAKYQYRFLKVHRDSKIGRKEAQISIIQKYCCPIKNRN